MTQVRKETTFHDQISKNRIKTFLLFGGFLLFLVGVIAACLYFITGKVDVISVGVGSAAAFVFLIISYLVTPKIALMVNHAEEITADSEPVLWNVVEELSLASGSLMPRVHVMRREPGLNAFATGLSLKSGHVVVTQGLLDSLNREELQGVIAHELSHLRNGDIKVMTMAAAMASVIGIITALATRVMMFGGNSNNRNPAGAIISIVALLLLAILAPLAALVIQSAISRKRESLADASAVELTRNPAGLESALAKIGGASVVSSANSERAHMFFSNPLSKKNMTGFVNKMFATHPPIEERIQILRDYQGE